MCRTYPTLLRPEEGATLNLAFIVLRIMARCKSKVYQVLMYNTDTYTKVNFRQDGPDTQSADIENDTAKEKKKANARAKPCLHYTNFPGFALG